jgi:hypothetical protein
MGMQAQTNGFLISARQNYRVPNCHGCVTILVPAIASLVNRVPLCCREARLVEVSSW